MKRGIFLALIMFLTSGVSFSSENANVQTAPALKSDSVYLLRPKYEIEQTEPAEKPVVQIPDTAPTSDVKKSDEDVQPKSEEKVEKAIDETVVKPVVAEEKIEQKAETEMKAIDGVPAKEKLNQAEEKVESVQIPVEKVVPEPETQLKSEQPKETVKEDTPPEEKNTEEIIKKEMPVSEENAEEKVENIAPLKEVSEVQPQEEQKILPVTATEIQPEEKSIETEKPAKVKDEQVQNQNTNTTEQVKQTEVQAEDKKLSHANELETAEPEEKFSKTEEYLPEYNTEEIVPDLKEINMPKLKINPVKIVPMKVDSTGEVDSRIKLLNYKTFEETDKYIKKNLTYSNNVNNNVKSKLPLNVKPLDNNINLSMINVNKQY